MTIKALYYSKPKENIIVKTMKNKQQEDIMDKVRKICTYYSELGEGTCGYNLTEEQFKKLDKLINSAIIEERERLLDKIEKEVIDIFPSSEFIMPKRVEKGRNLFAKLQRQKLKLLRQKIGDKI